MFKLPDLGPIFALALVGITAIIFGIGYAIWWLIQHVRSA